MVLGSHNRRVLRPTSYKGTTIHSHFYSELIHTSTLHIHINYMWYALQFNEEADYDSPPLGGYIDEAGHSQMPLLVQPGTFSLEQVFSSR